MDIYLIKDIKADFPFLSAGVVKAGIHEAVFNQFGAVSCKSDTNELIGIKLDEFQFLNEKDRNEWIKLAYPNIPPIQQVKIDMKECEGCFYRKEIRDYEYFYTELQEIRRSTDGFDTFTELTEKLMDEFEKK